MFWNETKIKKSQENFQPAVYVNNVVCLSSTEKLLITSKHPKNLSSKGKLGRITETA